MTDKFKPSELSYKFVKNSGSFSPKDLAAAYSEYQYRIRYDFVMEMFDNKGIEITPEQIKKIAKDMTGYVSGEDWIWEDLASAEREFTEDAMLKHILKSEIDKLSSKDINDIKRCLQSEDDSMTIMKFNGLSVEIASNPDYEGENDPEFFTNFYVLGKDTGYGSVYDIESGKKIPYTYADIGGSVSLCDLNTEKAKQALLNDVKSVVFNNDSNNMLKNALLDNSLNWDSITFDKSQCKAQEAVAPQRDVVKNAQVADKVAGHDINKKK